ncbi:hypothetical protein MOMA_08906 [Moraxella macacae 0408225]|uniref:Cytoskeleton protein RodZ-like C-terminal domain-containing protein n=1 Tax=Moraxella macacae 0408225 TaxID=1230338 RepID=L2F6Z7_9GAMM|nr:RodZ domain-containing protein [Moraxella macacae]ELA08665.1 hypothetical protein MOMA_08906 [Moraxella macacae 0408225]
MQTKQPVKNSTQAMDMLHPLGQRLKQAREKKGLSLDDVVNETHILKRHLVALENADFEALPQPTFARGFAVNYGRFLGFDSQVISQSFDAQYPSELRKKYESFDNAPLQPMGTLQRDSRGGIKINWFLIGGILVVLIVATMIFKTVKNAHHENQPAEIVQEVTPQEQATGASLSNAGSAIGSHVHTASAASTTGLSTLEIWVKNKTTINITDATGKVLLQGKQARGGYNLSGQAPFNVQIDKASNVNIDFNKQPIKISDYAQNNQANFTLQ